MTIKQPNIILLRHGLTEHNNGFYGSTDSQLTLAGREAMLASVSPYQFDLVLSSPLQRCAQVAHTIATHHQCPCKVESHWQEYHFGDWEGAAIDSLWENQASDLEAFWKNPYHFVPNNAEPFADFLARIEQAKIATQQYQNKKVLIVSHAGVIRGLRLLAQQATTNEWLTYPVDHASLHQLCPISGQIAPMTNEVQNQYNDPLNSSAKEA
ncbi:MAG: histidine phosphatase family protein [Thiotrichales bacterium]|jgi:alpha-ribazole phosphatase|nr:histidine phosphatase family protein [Thiotrichales bacterium]